MSKPILGQDSGCIVPVCWRQDGGIWNNNAGESFIQPFRTHSSNMNKILTTKFSITDKRVALS
ncbi:MAG: hypothetical protein IPP48_13285 [Chitinophagaceae bacterium]|nr:hypothetical protein [Chitinophagaceae bacterium]